MIEIELKDNQYPEKGFTHLRIVSRGIVLDGNGLFALHRIHRDDIFGNEDYYETPGGGVDEGETVEEALKRECEEELGEEVEILGKLGIVKDAYNLIGRKNENHYFLCQKLSEGKPPFDSDGDCLIQETIWVSLDEGIEKMRSQKDCGVSALVKARELPVLMEAKCLFG